MTKDADRSKLHDTIRSMINEGKTEYHIHEFLSTYYNIPDDEIDRLIASLRQTVRWPGEKQAYISKEPTGQDPMVKAKGKFKVGDNVTTIMSGRQGKVINVSPDLVRVRLENGDIASFDEGELEKV